MSGRLEIVLVKLFSFLYISKLCKMYTCVAMVLLGRCLGLRFTEVRYNYLSQTA